MLLSDQPPGLHMHSRTKLYKIHLLSYLPWLIFTFKILWKNTLMLPRYFYLKYCTHIVVIGQRFRVILMHFAYFSYSKHSIPMHTSIWIFLSEEESFPALPFCVPTKNSPSESRSLCIRARLHVSIHNTNPAVKHWGLKKAQGKMTLDIEYAVFSILEDKIQVTYLKNSKYISIFLEIFINYSLPSKLYELVSIILLHLAQECNIASITPTVQWYTHLSLGQSIKDINLFYTGHQMAISSWQHFVYYWHTLHSRW